MADTSNRILSIAALISSLVAIGLFTFQSIASRSQVEVSDRIDELEREVALLQGNVFSERGRLDEEGVVDTGGLRSGTQATVNIGDDYEEMRWAMTARGFMPATQEHIERSEKVIFDENQNAESKLTAARVLRRSGRLDDDGVREMIAVFHASDNHHLQASILGALDGVSTPELAPTLLKVSAENQSGRVRRQAVDAMSGFLPDPELEDWLRYVIKNDSESRVREEARRMLERFGSEVNE